MKNIIVLFGGRSAEHEVSVITGLQVLENIDRKKYTPYAIKLDKNNQFQYYDGLVSRKNYLEMHPQIVDFSRDNKGAYFETGKIIKKKIYVDTAYLAFHGGNGESGPIQGFLEILDIPYTSPNVESSSIAMNKQITKQIVKSYDISVVDGISVCDQDVKQNVDQVIKNLRMKLPLIIKPVHLGSSIAINIAKTKVELKKYLLEAAQVDTEIVVEKLITNFEEYNISVRQINSQIITSEIEKPLSTDDILSFADKYQRGGKKTGGMASLQRDLPAKISSTIEKKIKSTAVDVFKAIRAKGLVRIDFMVVGETVYVTEVNPIPGSMSFYLWEASGVSFKQQITDLLEQAAKDTEIKKSKQLDYTTDIVEKFVKN